MNRRLNATKWEGKVNIMIIIIIIIIIINLWFTAPEGATPVN